MVKAEARGREQAQMDFAEQTNAREKKFEVLLADGIKKATRDANQAAAGKSVREEAAVGLHSVSRREQVVNPLFSSSFGAFLGKGFG